MDELDSEPVEEEFEVLDVSEEPIEAEPAAVDELDTELVEEEFEVPDVSEESVESWMSWTLS